MVVVGGGGGEQNARFNRTARMTGQPSKHHNAHTSSGALLLMVGSGAPRVLSGSKMKLLWVPHTVFSLPSFSHG